MPGETVPVPMGPDVVGVVFGIDVDVVLPVGVDVVVDPLGWVVVDPPGWVVVDPPCWVVVVVEEVGGTHGSRTVNGRAIPTRVVTPLIVFEPMTRNVFTPRWTATSGPVWAPGSNVTWA